MQQLTYTFTARVLRPLVAFGLMERGSKKTARESEVEYRTTPLFHALLRFDLPAQPPPPFRVGGDRRQPVIQ